MQPILIAEDEKRRLEIYQEENPESPREWDNTTVMLGWHREYKIGDENPYKTPDAFLSDKRLQRRIAIIKPLYLYDHSMQSISTRSFVGRAQHAEWDSGQVGFIYILKTTVRKEWKGDLKKAEEVLEGEVEDYDRYMKGDIYGFRLYEKCDKCGQHTPDPKDSVWGFFGTDWDNNGLKESLPAEAQGLIALLKEP